MPHTRLTTLAISSLLCLATGATAPASSAAANPVQLENARPGTPGWDLPGGTSSRIPTASKRIQGYASEISTQPGDVLHLHVSTTPAASYRIEIFRLGWYHGDGGRRIACIPSCAGSEPGASRPVTAPDPSTGYLDAGWPVTDTIVVGPGWTSGYFVVKLTLTSGPDQGQASWIPFIVRAAPGVHSAILVQASVNTWEAYNNWGGKSLYTFNSTGPVVPASKSVEAAMVSFNRPFGSDINAGPFSWEYDRVRFLERRGYDVSYQTDVDTDLNPASLLNHRLDIVSGHDEYWSNAMRNAFEAARGTRVNLAFLGGNIGYWQLRYANSDRTLIEYRSATLDPEPNPALKTVQFSQLSPPRPECELLGVGEGGLANNSDPPRSYSVTPAALPNPWFKGTGFAAGDTIFGSVGYEWDYVQPGCAVPPLQVLLHFAGLTGVKGSAASADAVTYTAPSGARVFSDGSMQVAWALDDFGHSPHADARVQRLFANIFDDLGATPSGFAPNGRPGLKRPGPGAVVASPLSFRWSAPATGLQTYGLDVDNRVLLTVNARGCRRGSCTASVRLAPGRHSWMVIAGDGLGNAIASTIAAFTVDNTPPARFTLRSPRSRAILHSRRPRFSWAPAHDRGAGIARYVVLVDGKRVGTSTRTSYTLRHQLAYGWHTWTVLAIDRAGNQRAAPARRFLVKPAR